MSRRAATIDKIRFLLTVLNRMAGGKNELTTNYREIAEQTGWSREAARKWVAALEEFGRLSRRVAYGPRDVPIGVHLKWSGHASTESEGTQQQSALDEEEDSKRRGVRHQALEDDEQAPQEHTPNLRGVQDGAGGACAPPSVDRDGAAPDLGAVEPAGDLPSVPPEAAPAPMEQGGGIGVKSQVGVASDHPMTPLPRLVYEPDTRDGPPPPREPPASWVDGRFRQGCEAASAQGIVTRHVVGIMAGEIPSNEWIKLAAERWIKDTERTDIWMDWDQVDRMVQFIQGLQLVGSHAGQDWVLLPWQVWFLAGLVGWRMTCDGLPRTRFGLLQVARKNGKSTLMAGLCLWHLIGQAKKGRSIHVIANKAEQAKIVLDTARDMARDLLPDRDTKGRKSVQHNKICCDFGTMDALTAQEKSLDGLSPSLWIGDEASEWRGRFITKMTTSTVAHEDGLGVLITTPGNNPELVYPELVRQCEKVLLGEVNLDDQFCLIYGVDEQDDIGDRSCWPKANPSLGASLRESVLERQWASMSLTPMGRQEFTRFHLARPTDVVGRWLEMRFWDAVVEPSNVPDGAEVWIGVDLSKSFDMSAVVIARPDAAGIVHLKGTYWYPEQNAKEREIQWQLPFRRWAMEDRLILSPGREIAWEPIRQYLKDLCLRYQVRRIAVDPWAASYFTEMLHADGLPVVLHSQNNRMMAPAAQEWQNLWVGGRFRHSGDPVLRAACANAGVKTDDSGNLYPVKGRSCGIIDPLIAAIMAVHCWALDQGTAPSMYEQGAGVG